MITSQTISKMKEELIIKLGIVAKYISVEVIEDYSHNLFVLKIDKKELKIMIILNKKDANYFDIIVQHNKFITTYTYLIKEYSMTNCALLIMKDFIYFNTYNSLVSSI